MAIFLLGGSLASGLSLTGRVGRRRQVRGTVTAIKTPARDVTEVTCHVGPAWRGHRAGQFAFVTFDRMEGRTRSPLPVRLGKMAPSLFSSNPSATIPAISARKSAWVRQVKVEGPYGSFNFDRRNRKSHQIWIAGGIGITPFLAWLEALEGSTATVPSLRQICITARATPTRIPWWIDSGCFAVTFRHSSRDS